MELLQLAGVEWQEYRSYRKMFEKKNQVIRVDLRKVEWETVPSKEEERKKQKNY